MTKEIDDIKKEAKFVDLTTDSGFKAVFCDRNNVDALKALLNSFLPEDRQVQSVTYIDREMEGFTIKNKGIRIDLRCQDQHGRYFIVEIQKNKKRNFYTRCLAYATTVFNSHIPKGDTFYDKAVPVYLLAMMVEPAMEPELYEPEELISWFVMKEKDHNYFAPNLINLIFVRLNKAKIRLDDCETAPEKLCHVMKTINTLDECPEAFRGGVYEPIFEASAVAAFSPEKRLEYESDMRTENDYQNEIETAKMLGKAEGKEEGRQEGLAEGEAKGKAEEKRKTANRMLDEGISVDLIVKCTGLTIEEIEALNK